MIPYKLVKRHFTDETRKLLEEPFIFEGKSVCSTNGHIIIIIDDCPWSGDLGKGDDHIISRTNEMLGAHHTGIYAPLDADRIAKEVSEAPKVPLFEDCEHCDGEGEGECEHCGSDFECRHCSGSGKTNVKIGEEYDDVIKVGNKTFDPKYLDLILKTLGVYGERETATFNQTGRTIVVKSESVKFLLCERTPKE